MPRRHTVHLGQKPGLLPDPDPIVCFGRLSGGGDCDPRGEPYGGMMTMGLPFLIEEGRPRTGFRGSQRRGDGR